MPMNTAKHLNCSWVLIMNNRVGIFVCLQFLLLNVQALQSELMQIASQEAAIVNIGANKYMMLYGVNNPIPIINRWNEIEKRPALTKTQIEQINALELKKHEILKSQKELKAPQGSEIERF